MGEQFIYSRISRSILLATGLTLAGSHAMASGFRIPEISTVGTATSNALVANTTETGALAYNPAAMSFHDTNSLNAGITRITYEPEVNPDNGTATGSTGEDTFWVPNAYFMVDGYDNMSFGLAINAPFGLETKWPSGTFNDFDDQQLAPALSRIKMFNVNPNLAWKLDDSSSFAFGINYYDLDELAFNTNGATIKGSGGDLGWNIAYQKQLNSNLSFGASYRSSVEVDVSGIAHFYGTSYGGPNPPAAASATLEFPDLFQAGVHYQINNQFGVELDVERTGWSSFDKIIVDYGSGTTTSTNNWDDTWAYRLGAIYQMDPRTRLMFGYSYDETPQPDEHFSARVPDNDRQLFSLGMTRDFGNWNLELAYMLVDVDTRTVNSTDDFGGTATNEPNGTDAYNGTYESDSDLISVGVSMEF